MGPEEPNPRLDAVLQKLRSIAVRSGPGARLPSVRTLIRSLGVSQSVVVRALDRLETEGVLERRARSGLFVAPGYHRRPRLILLEPNMFVAPSPFGELLLEDVLRPYRDQPEDAEVLFTHPQVGHVKDENIRTFLPREIWAKLEVLRYASVTVLGIDGRVVREIERLGNVTVSFGSLSRYQIHMAMLEACQLGVQELVRLGCQRIALYNTPFVSMREVFMAAISSHGVEETLLPHDEHFERYADDYFVRHYRLVERGWRAAHRALGPSATAKLDAILSLDDMFTQGFLMGMLELGLYPGRDLQIATYANAGSPTLAAWERDMVRLEFSTARLASLLHEGAQALEAGAALGPGWGPGEYVPGYGPTQMVMARPTLRTISRAELRA
jgi:hypothetical protein